MELTDADRARLAHEDHAQSLYHWAQGQMIDFHMTYHDHPHFTTTQTYDGCVMRSPDGAELAFTTNEWAADDREGVFAAARAFIAEHANVRGMKPSGAGKWIGARWCDELSRT